MTLFKLMHKILTPTGAADYSEPPEDYFEPLENYFEPSGNRSEPPEDRIAIYRQPLCPYSAASARLSLSCLAVDHAGYRVGDDAVRRRKDESIVGDRHASLPRKIHAPRHLAPCEHASATVDYEFWGES